MKGINFLFALALVTTATLAIAADMQKPTKASATPDMQKPAKAAATPDSASVSTGKKAALSSADKQLVAKGGDALLTVIHICEPVKGGSQPSAPVLKLSDKATKNTNEAWGDLAALASAHAAELSKTEASASDKRDTVEMHKLAADKFDKAFLKSLSKETKRLAAAYGDGAKSASEAELRAYFTKWQPTMSTLRDQVNAAEIEESKKK